MITNNSAKTSDWIQRVNGVIYARDIPAVTIPLETAAEQYRRLRNAIADSGIPMLTDDEARAEVAALRGDDER